MKTTIKFEPKQNLMKQLSSLNNKEDAKYWQEWNVMCLKHCIGQLEKL
jgi:hypothetical protein